MATFCISAYIMPAMLLYVVEKKHFSLPRLWLKLCVILRKGEVVVVALHRERQLLYIVSLPSCLMYAYHFLTLRVSNLMPLVQDQLL